MDYEQKYKDALETARKINSGEGVAAPPDWTVYEVIFPELKESEDEKIRNALIEYLKGRISHGDFSMINNITVNDMLAWLEKQVKNSAIFQHENKTCKENDDSLIYFKPKFKVGDWIVKENIVYHIDKISGIYLTLSTLDGRALVYHKNVLDSDKVHFWTIADAKDGDVLVSEYNKPFIYNGKHISDSIGAHCGIDIHDQFTVSTTEYDWTDYDVKPATKEQSDLLFKEMKEAGWEWDAEKKKLKKINWIKEFKKEWRNSNDNKR